MIQKYNLFYKKQYDSKTKFYFFEVKRHIICNLTDIIYP